MEVSVLKLHYIYLFIGISTLALNIILTLHIIRKHARASSKVARDCDDIITFSLTRDGSAEDATTAAVAYDDTVPLEG